MPRVITHTLTIWCARRDQFGNIETAFEVINTDTGRAARFHAGHVSAAHVETMIRYGWDVPGEWTRSVLVTLVDKLPIREFARMVKGWPHVYPDRETAKMIRARIDREGADIDIGGVLRGYLTAALWTSQGEDAGCGIPETSGEFDPSPYIDRFTKAAREEARTYCAAFVDANNADLRDDTGEPIDPDQIGHDLWLTRNREGAGFWDRPYFTDDQGERLTKAAHAMGGRRIARLRGGRYIFEST